MLVHAAPLLSLASALEAGMPLERVLTAPELSSALPAPLVTTLRSALRRGAPLGSALAAAGCVDEGAGAVLDVGAEGGFLPRALRLVAAMRDEARRRRRQVLGALAGPTLVLGAGSVLLPLPKLVTSGAAAYTRAAAPGIAFIAGVLALVFVVWPRASPRARATVGAVLAQVPGVRTVVVNAAHAALWEVLGALVAAGVPLTRALPMAVRSAGISSWIEGIPELSRRLASGAPLARVLDACVPLDGTARARLAVGEESGRLDEVLPRLALEARERASTGSRLLASGAGALAFAAVALMMGLGIVRGVTGYFQQIERLTAEDPVGPP